MPTPLSDALLENLRDPTTALAAAFVIARWHPELVSFAARTMAGPEPCEHKPRPRGRAKANGGRRKDETRLSKRDQADERLLEAMRRNAEATIGELATVVGKSRSSIVSALHRLRDAGLAQSVEGKWLLTEEPAPLEPVPKWVKPPSAIREQAHA